MNRLELLKEFKELLNHNLLYYSSNYLMDKPKNDCDEEWKKTQEKLNIIEEMIEEEGKEKLSFTQEKILKMYPNTQFYVRNSNGGLLAGTMELQEAIKYAEKYKNEYLNNSLNKRLGVFVYDKENHNVYVAKGTQKNSKYEETEELE